jgi:hypothetical protein
MPKRTLNPLNQCCACGEDFASLAAFDAHILSKPADAKFDCMQELELKREGWSLDPRGRWTSPALKAQAEQVAANRTRAFPKAA